ncbi:hypothetical protein OF83DRAFT_612136 [Amylostereum chailletii]|nr:hypothetical protein OF83DRAFT_612136 [Amylostereum chailletii]
MSLTCIVILHPLRIPTARPTPFFLKRLSLWIYLLRISHLPRSLCLALGTHYCKHIPYLALTGTTWPPSAEPSSIDWYLER